MMANYQELHFTFCLCFFSVQTFHLCVQTSIHSLITQDSLCCLQNRLCTTQPWLWQLKSYIKWSNVWMYMLVTHLFWDSLSAGNPFISTSSRIAVLSQSRLIDDHQGFALWTIMFSMRRNQRHCTFFFLLGYQFFFCKFILMFKTIHKTHFPLFLRQSIILTYKHHSPPPTPQHSVFRKRQPAASHTNIIDISAEFSQTLKYGVEGGRKCFLTFLACLPKNTMK